MLKLGSFFTNSMGILTSRILGFIRDLLTASILGANIYSDIFFVAFKLPNLFRRIFAEGAFSQAFLPTFTKTNKKAVFAIKVLLNFTLFLLLLSFIVMLFAPLITKLLAYGFDEKTIALAAPLVRINFWYLLFIFLVTFCSSLLHYRSHFATTAFSTALLNLSLITALLLSNTKTPDKTIYLLSYAVVIGGFLQLLSHLYALKKYRLCPLLIGGFKYLKKRSEKTKFYNLFFHGLVGSSTAQISAFIDTWLASFLISGSISYLYYANRIFQLPLALFAIALSISIFPQITKKIKIKDLKTAQKLLKEGFWMLLFLLCICTLGGIVLNQEIIWLLFERGSFNPSDTANTAKVLSMYLIGLTPFGLAKLFSLWLYAQQKQKQAAKISMISLAFNIFFSLALIKPLGVMGLALSGSLSGFILLILTINAYGLKDFLAIMEDIKLLYLFGILIIEWIVLYYLKEFLHVYI